MNLTIRSSYIIACRNRPVLRSDKNETHMEHRLGKVSNSMTVWGVGGGALTGFMGS